MKKQYAWRNDVLKIKKKKETGFNFRRNIQKNTFYALY